MIVVSLFLFFATVNAPRPRAKTGMKCAEQRVPQEDSKSLRRSHEHPPYPRKRDHIRWGTRDEPVGQSGNDMSLLY